MSDVPWSDLGNLPSPVTPPVNKNEELSASLPEGADYGAMTTPHDAFNAPLDDHAHAVAHGDSASEDHDDGGHDDGHDDHDDDVGE